MRSRNAPTLLVLAALAAAPLGISTPAGAQRGGYSWSTEHSRPVHGYSGPAGFGPRRYWCDYQRLPNRKCTVSRSGKETCRIVSWTLQQHCY